MLGVSQRGLLKLCREGLSYIRLDRTHRLFRLEDIESFLESRRVASPEPRRIDRERGPRLPSPRKGGDRKKADAEEDRARLRREVRSLCQ